MVYFYYYGIKRPLLKLGLYSLQTVSKREYFPLQAFNINETQRDQPGEEMKVFCGFSYLWWRHDQQLILLSPIPVSHHLGVLSFICNFDL